MFLFSFSSHCLLCFSVLEWMFYSYPHRNVRVNRSQSEDDLLWNLNWIFPSELYRNVFCSWRRYPCLQVLMEALISAHTCEKRPRNRSYSYSRYWTGSYIWTRRKMETWLIITGMHTTLALVKLKAEKRSGLNWNRTHDLYDTGHCSVNWVIKPSGPCLKRLLSI